jgi:hypothetical protein
LSPDGALRDRHRGPALGALQPARLMNQQNDDALETALKELKMQVEINRRLAAALIDVRLELAQLKLKHRIS